jgi:hypothetical protein
MTKMQSNAFKIERRSRDEVATGLALVRSGTTNLP